MGALFRSRYRDRNGDTQIAKTWSLQYKDAAGRLIRESTGETDRKKAERRLRLREGASAEGGSRTPGMKRASVSGQPSSGAS